MGGQTGNRRPPTAPLQHTFGFTLVLHLLLFFTPLDPSRSVEIITVRLNSECFRFSLSLPGSFPHPSVLGSLDSLKTSLSDEHGPRCVHLCLRLCQLWCVFNVCMVDDGYSFRPPAHGPLWLPPPRSGTRHSAGEEPRGGLRVCVSMCVCGCK